MFTFIVTIVCVKYIYQIDDFPISRFLVFFVLLIVASIATLFGCVQFVASFHPYKNSQQRMILSSGDQRTDSLSPSVTVTVEKAASSATQEVSSLSSDNTRLQIAAAVAKLTDFQTFPRDEESDGSSASSSKSTSPSSQSSSSDDIELQRLIRSSPVLFQPLPEDKKLFYEVKKNRKLSPIFESPSDKMSPSSGCEMSISPTSSISSQRAQPVLCPKFTMT